MICSRRAWPAVLAVVVIGCTSGEPAGPRSPTAATSPTPAPSPSVEASQAHNGREAPTGERIIAWTLVGPDRLVVQFSGCEADPAVSVEQTATRVGVLVGGPNPGCEPVFGHEIGLDEPLGGREVVDRSTGRVVAREFTRPEFLADATRRASGKWRDVAVSDYRLGVVQTSATQPRATATFEVRGREVVPGDAGSSGDGQVEGPTTVEEAFELIEAAVQQRQQVHASFHDEWGHPTQVVVVEDPTAAPNGTTWFITVTPTANGP